jgi:hypothetical protein
LSWTRPNTKKRFISYQGLISWMRSYGTNIAEDLKRLQPNEDTDTKWTEEKEELFIKIGTKNQPNSTSFGRY